MAYEVDFLPVGNGEKSGDAIALRFGDLASQDRRDQCVVLIDGGTKESGQALVDHVGKHYHTDHVDLVVNTHPDGDHSSGLTVVLEQLSVGQLWVHRPWDHSERICHMFNDGRITSGGLSARLKAALENARELEKLAKRKGVPIVEPFAGVQHTACGGRLTVLGPTQQYYEALLTDFRSTPDKKEAYSMAASLLKSLQEGAVAVAQRVRESFDVETLKEPEDDATSAENNSSAILLLQIDGKQLLFTGDAGVPALERADDWAESAGIALSDCCFSQVPHHGSRRNVGPSILDRILGPRRSDDQPDKAAFVSASKHAPKHPSRRVTNAYRRRGARVITTEGAAIWYYSADAPARSGYSAAIPVPFHTTVEED